MLIVLNSSTNAKSQSPSRSHMENALVRNVLSQLASELKSLVEAPPREQLELPPQLRPEMELPLQLLPPLVVLLLNFVFSRSVPPISTTQWMFESN
jgi:hypothetical protein